MIPRIQKSLQIVPRKIKNTQGYLISTAEARSCQCFRQNPNVIVMVPLHLVFIQSDSSGRLQSEAWGSGCFWLIMRHHRASPSSLLWNWGQELEKVLWAASYEAVSYGDPTPRNGFAFSRCHRTTNAYDRGSAVVERVDGSGAKNMCTHKSRWIIAFEMKEEKPSRVR